MQKPFLAASDKLEKLSDFVYRMLWLKLGDEMFLLSNSNLAAMLAKDAKEYNSLRGALPSWVYFFNLTGYEYFPEERLVYQENDMVDAAQQFGIEPAGAVAGVSAYELLRMSQKAAEEPYWKLRYKGGCQDIFFLTTLDRVPKFVDVMYGVAEQRGFPTSDIGIYIQPMVQGTSCHCEFNLFFDPSVASEAHRVRDMYTQAGEALMNAGAFFSRPYGAMADLAYRRDGETTAALRKVKQIFDPNNVMNSGKLCF